MNVKENGFSSKREFKKELRGTLMLAAWYELWQIEVKFKIPLFRYFYNHLGNYTKTIIR